jgi:hypothetical protein
MEITLQNQPECPIRAIVPKSNEGAGVGRHQFGFHRVGRVVARASGFLTLNDYQGGEYGHVWVLHLERSVRQPSRSPIYEPTQSRGTNEEI